MKRLLIILLCLLPLPLVGEEALGFKIGSYNLFTSDSRLKFISRDSSVSHQRYWCNSATAVADMIVHLDCDILGLQEICDSIWSGPQNIRSLVEDRGGGYQWILYPNTRHGHISYDVAIAFRRERFDTLATGIFWIGGHPDRPETRNGEPNNICRPCVWARLSDKATGREFYFMNAHNVVPQKYENDEWPPNRGNILNLQEIRRLGEALIPEDIPSILVGDLNVSHKADDWKNISEGRWKDVYTISRDSGSLSSDDREWGTQNTKDESSWSTWHPDHIMTDGFNATGFRVFRDKFPTADGSLHYPSDHFPIVAIVSFEDRFFENGWEAAVSPDGRIRMEVLARPEGLKYRVFADGKAVVSPSEVSMCLSDGTVFGMGSPQIIEKDTNGIALHYDGYRFEARAFDDGVAWRWLSGERKPYKVLSEQAVFRFDAGMRTRVSYTHKQVDPFQDDFQNTYTILRFPVWAPRKALLDAVLGPDDTAVLLDKEAQPPLAVVPTLVETPGIKALIAESDVVSYPGMFLKPFGCGFDACFAGYPASERQGGKRNLQWIVTSREDHIASCDGKARPFPWRVICIARDDKELASNTLITRLASPPTGDFSWVKPGKSAWEWWSSCALEGVDFNTGINTATYKAFIDFASRHGIEYVLLDEGWSVKFADDLLSVVPEVDLREIIDYGRLKNVGIILWAGYSAFAKEMEKVCRHYSEMGVAGFKIDFLERNDQPIQEFMFRAAETAAKHKLLINFHGCPPPTGLQKRFPNLLNYEGIFGLEQMRTKALPDYDMVTFDVTAPFIRCVAGPADYTPGSFLNATRESYVPVKTAPMSQGTRSRQLAAYVVFYGPLQMLCDSPSRYEADPDCAEFLYRVPTVWDETRVLDGKTGEYIITARRKGGTWYVGAFTDWTARDFTIDLSDLGLTQAFVEAWEDGPDAAVNASDWRKRSFTASAPFTISLAPGGGWAAIINNP